MPRMPSSRFNAYTWARDHRNAQLVPLDPVVRLSSSYLQRTPAVLKILQISEARQLFLSYEERYLPQSAHEIENETMYQLFVHLVDHEGVVSSHPVNCIFDDLHLLRSTSW